ESARAAGDQIGRLTGLAKDVPGRDRSEPVLRAAADAEARVAGAEAAEREASEGLEAARTALDEALAEVGGRSGLSEADRLIERLGAADETAGREGQRAGAAKKESDTAAAAVEAAQERLERASADHGQATTRHGDAVKAAEEADQALHAARHGAMAATLRSELAAGDRCPVCEQTVATVPDASDPHLEAATAAQEAAREALEAAATTLTASAAAAAAAGEALEAARETAASAASQASAAEQAALEAVERAAEVRAAVVDLLGDDDPRETLQRRKAAVAAAEEAVGAAEARGKEAARLAAAARQGSREAVDVLEELARRLARLAGELGLDVEIGRDPESIGAALGSVREGWMALKEAADDAAGAAAGTLEAARAERAELLVAADLAPEAVLPDAVGEARATLAATGREISTLEARLEELRALEEREADTIGARDRLTRIVDDLAPSKFLRFVLDEKRRALALLGSSRLEELSGGRYRFTDDGAFEIVDLMAAEQARPAASLSGGETFLASLALALALAEMVGSEGGRLDAFFLDEGFGSLDPEHIDLAMDGIERLVAGAGDRLVVVVSHVPALRDRIEDLVVLDKDSLTGDTVVRRGAEPGDG
ncbi:MAG TPA: SbcC/MukB-like Walker B domain-containing protein, partial [Acidimicrobiia bacterium]|nr:SbcC/MukB-like Walker B domain-containing protein [Acidimicrobiia bacterium]